MFQLIVGEFIMYDVTKISKSNQVVVPSKFRKKFNLKPEDHLVWRDSENNDEIIITIQKKVSAEDITGLIKEELPYNSVEIKKR